MSVFKNSLCLSLTLSLVLGTTSVFAEGGDYAQMNMPAPQDKRQRQGQRPQSKPSSAPRNTDGPRTAYSYDPTQFCSNAPSMLENLNKENADKLGRIEAINDELRDLENSKTLLNGIVKLKDSYTKALKEISMTEKSVLAQQKSEKLETLDNMKKVVRNGLTLNALALMLKDTDLEKDESFTLAGICKKNEATTLCKKENTGIGQLGNFLFKYQRPLDTTLANFRDAFRTISKQNRPMVAEDAKKLLASIPDSVSPEGILAILEKTSPKLSGILASTSSKDDFDKCMSDTPNGDKDAELGACKRLFTGQEGDDGKPKKAFMEELNSQIFGSVAKIKNLGQVVQDAHHAGIDEVRSDLSQIASLSASQKTTQLTAQTRAKVKKDFIKQSVFMETVVSQENPALKKKIEETSDPMAKAILSAQMEASKLDPMTGMFYNPNFSSASNVEDVTRMNEEFIKKALATSSDWKKNCLDPEAEIDINACASAIKNIDGKIVEQFNNYKTKAAELQSRMAAIRVEDDDKFLKIENLKKFVAEKYIRSCVDGSKVTSTKQSIKLDTKIDGKCFADSQTFTTLKGLGQNLNEILVNMKFAQDINTQKDSTGAFNKEEMASFTSTCNERGVASEYRDVCGIIYGEQVAREKVKDTKDWDKFNNDYWVSYDDKSPNGYSITKKKGALRVFGEGVLPVVPQMIPTFFGNYMMKQNINTLTSQALYQKQMLHNVDFYNTNPWMYNYNMFGITGTTGIQGYGNPFATTTTTTGSTNTTGFGF